MILGTGIDLVEIVRFSESYQRLGQRFLDRIFTPSELAYCLDHKDPVPHLAVRFAAKEAVSKAFGTGIGEKVGWQDIEIRRHPNGAPVIVLQGKAMELFQQLGGTAIHLSMSHTDSLATAMVTLEGRDAPANP